MNRFETKSIHVFGLLLFALGFYSAWSFWISLLDGKVFKPDLWAPIAYGFCALAGAIALFVISHQKSQIHSVRITLCVLAIALMVMPFAFYFLSSPLFILILQIVFWIISLAFLVFLVYLVWSAPMNKIQRIVGPFAIIVSLIAPFMPWWELIISLTKDPQYFFAEFYYYSTWSIFIVAFVWGVTAYIMMVDRFKAVDQFKAADRRMKVMVIMGLCFFLVGISKPVQHSSQLYEQRTYVYGQLTDISTVELSNVNLFLLLGMGLILFSLLVMGGLHFSKKG